MKINKNYNRFHSSRRPFKLQHITYNQSYAFKPCGLWYGIDDSWTSWMESSLAIKSNIVYQVILNDNKILKINNSDELFEFTKEYGNGHRILKEIHWNRVSKDYDGIEILINPILSHGLWYMAWDTISGCVWNMENVKILLKE